jgi:two-component system, response regulator YesN
MYRLLVVDDEEFITDGMAELLQGNRDMDLDVYKAYSGEEAINLLRRTRMDLVLSDIHMPGMDGIQLLEQIHHNWPNCHVIFLSGYNDFGFIYEAIKYSGTKYLLKSESHDKVLAAVRETLEEIRQEIQTKDLMRRAQQEMEAARETFQTDFCMRLLHGAPESLADTELLEKLDIRLNREASVLLLVGSLDHSAATKDYALLMQRRFSVRWVLNKYLGGVFHELTVFDDEERIVSLLQPKSVPGEERDAEQRYREAVVFLKGTLELVQSACKASINDTVSLIFTDHSVPWKKIAPHYEKLTRLLSFQTGSGSEVLLTDTEFDSKLFGSDASSILPPDDDADLQMEELLGQRFEDVIRIQLHSGNEGSCLELFRPIADYLRREPSRNSGLATEAYLRVAVSLLSYINNHNLTVDLAFHIGQNQLTRPDSFASWTEAANYLATMIRCIFTLQREAGKRRTDTAIAYVQRYVSAHLGEDLSLVRLAEQVYLNPSYLSRLFKQATGTNLSDYIEHMRVKRAGELLVADNMKIQDIAAAVGYDAAGSFTRFFKKTTGMAPQDYRTNHIQKKIPHRQE